MENNKCRTCRKFGEKLFLKGERCTSPKCGIVKRNFGPGAHGGARRGKKSEYGLQLQEKQKAKFEYGLREKQFSLTFDKASHAADATGEAMLRILETRLDNVVYRLGWAGSRTQARQLVNHGHIKVNDKLVDIPSYQVKVGDTIEPADKEIVEKSVVDKAQLPAWLKSKSMKAEIVSLPAREQIETSIDEQLVVEFYSR
ncbi:MAG: 30S ribosomal protein S4 [Candidatus Berkelbacteria bacterium]